jgi:hypothetical protein
MAWRTSLLAFGLVTNLALATYAQTRPNFSGRWTLVPERS